MNNPIVQELPDKDKYFSVTNDNRIYLDLRATSESKRRLTLRHVTHAINQSDDNFLECVW